MNGITVQQSVLVFTLSVLTSNAYDFKQSNSVGLFPSIFNLATHAGISANATCGQNKIEQYTPLANSRGDVCNENDPDRSHPAKFALDGTERWWQAPSLEFGPAYHTVTLTVHLKQVYQVDYLILIAGPSPRPANWILERSLDGINWDVWQYQAISDEECWLQYGVEPRKGKPSYKEDDEVICTSYHSSIKPLESGEISISLVNGRPGAKGPSATLLEFTKARFIRLSFQKLAIAANDKVILGDPAHPKFSETARRYFYSIKDISIGGQCPCHGHASECPVLQGSGEYSCACRHNTCGSLCDSCCPMFNQRRWRPGKYISGNECERCQCFGHSQECYFDPLVEAERRSLNANGAHSGGGVCVDCQDKTEGVNCEKCIDGYFRPTGVSRFDRSPCYPCTCNTPGSLGYSRCYQDGSKSHQGHESGDCICKPGFTGPRCDSCAVGFTNYPECVSCPCSLDGTVGNQCTGDCRCKQHATGSRCDRCKPGYFALQAANPDGCTECFCYGVTSSCDSVDFGVEIIDHETGWMVTDLAGRLKVPPYWSSVTSGLTIAQEDISLDAYYWQAPEQYLGNKLISYGQMLTVHTSWHTGRGDTSGTPTSEPDIILEGGGFRIGFGTSHYSNKKNATIKLVFLEHDWYYLPGGGGVAKHDFMQCLGSLDRLLIRAKYHSDQLEGTLHTAAMQFGAKGSLSLTRTKAVEECNCPVGYEGLSCQQCSYGYTRVNNTLYKGECRKCNCYGHSATCDPMTLECGDCEHSTMGDQCQLCKKGFYGNAKIGRPNDCRPCKCPLEIPSNNFSPDCQVATLDYDRYSVSAEEYTCTACPQGYEGPHCERCANGYYGNPLTIGDHCKPCKCNGNADQSANRMCHHITGECLSCLGNTGGWNCEVCLAGYYGNPGDGYCKPCGCNKYGARDSECNPVSGECVCKEKYVGRTCGQCGDGFGNVRGGCRECACNAVGATGEGCQADTGACFCHVGVTGFACDRCLPVHFGFSNSGCSGCDCHPKGARTAECDIRNGSCDCQPKVEGRRCDSCISEHWGINSGSGCTKCECDMYGSLHNDCDDVTGQCPCKPGVGEPRCSACLVGYWGMSRSGCVKCTPCQKAGHVCDPDTGRCVCPVLTIGDTCGQCAPGTWDYHPYKGCSRCHCHQEGSLQGQCDTETGKCRCVAGYAGDHCDKCAPGFYNFPNCRACNCHPAGTDPEACTSGVCQCNDEGVCPCKTRVAGKKCASCAPSFFGLSSANPKGCTKCFCFGRSSECQQAQYSWTQLVMARPRKLGISRGDSRLPSEHGLLIVPGTEQDIVIGVTNLFAVPLYWRLPSMFLGDKVLSYNGYLRFSVETNGERMFGSEILGTYPLVLLKGNHNIHLMHFPAKLSGSGRYEVMLHEDQWVNQNNPQVPVSRLQLMVALQHIQDILIRATDSSDATMSTLHGVSLDTARPTPIGSPRPALGVEMCSCPAKYNSTSCQDPGLGFFRYYKESYVTSEIIIDLVGESTPCQCNGRADSCHPTTGFCQYCRENTAGAWCDICAAGYHGDPMKGAPCRPCQCPASDRNFAVTCTLSEYGVTSCQCEEGYTGPTCERCKYGYYGNPGKVGGKCLPCDCSPYGSETDQCQQDSGQCYCVAGVQGRDCSQCKPRHLLTHLRTCKNCDDACVGTLLDSLKAIKQTLDVANLNDLDPSPLTTLARIRDRTEYLEEKIVEMMRNTNNVTRLYTAQSILRPKADISVLKMDKLRTVAGDQLDKSRRIVENGQEVGEEVESMHRDIADLITYLDQHGREQAGAVSLSRALNEASNILNAIKAREFSEVDILTRTEMSESRILMDKVQTILFGEMDLTTIQTQAESVESLVNDLLQYLNDGINAAAEAGDINVHNNHTLGRTIAQCERIDDYSTNGAGRLAAGLKLIAGCRGTLDKSREGFQQLGNMFQTFQVAASNLEDREIGLSAVVEDYRTRFVQPCQANAYSLFSAAERIERMFERRAGINAEDALQAANAYRRIIEALHEAKDAAHAALETAIAAYKEIDPPGYDSLRRRSDQARLRSEDLRQEAQGLWKNADDLIIQTNGIKLDIEKHEFDLESKYQLVTEISGELDQHVYVSDLAKEVKQAAKKALSESETANRETLEMMNRIRIELGSEAAELNSFSAEELGSIPRKLGESHRVLQQVEKQAAYMERRSSDLYELNESVSYKLRSLRDRIKMARHAADNIHISTTGDPAKSGACLRSYNVGLSPTTHNQISIIYGIQSEARDSTLVFLPSSNKNSEGGFNFLAIEMVDRKIRFVWNLGAGTKAITHNVEIETAYRLDRQDTMWFKITAERIGNIGRLNVRRVSPAYDLPEYHQWVVGESPANANILDIHFSDKLWVGGAPDYYKTAGLQSGGVMNGVLYELIVDKEQVGLWNFASTFGCKAAYPGVTDLVSQHSCYSFKGDGYATQNQIRNYDSRYYAISLEFKTFDSDALLVMVVNHLNRQHLVLQLSGGRVNLAINYANETTLEFTSKKTYNSGQWVKVEAGRANRSGLETGVLRVTHSGVREDFVDTLPPLQVRELELAGSKLYFGGVPPDFPFQSFPRVKGQSLLGNMRGITTSNPGSNSLMNPLYTELGRINPFYGVQPSCHHRILKTLGLQGNGYIEVKSQPLRRDSSFGLSFKTKQREGVVMLSTFLGQPSGNIKDFYSVTFVGGKIRIVLGHNTDVAHFTTSLLYNDDSIHSLFINKQANKVFVYIDDVRVNKDEIVLSGSHLNIEAPTQGGLYLGGIPTMLAEQALKLGMLDTIDNMVGTIRDVAFLDEVSVRVVAMNEPVAFFNVNIGRG